MLIIRARQMEVFEENRKQSFEDTVRLRLSEKFPEEQEHHTPAGFRELIARSIARAVDYGITAEPQIAQFVELIVEFGETFQRSPAAVRARKILDNPSLPGSAKLQGAAAQLRNGTGGRTLRVFR